MSSIRLEEVVKKFTDKEVSLFKKKGREIKLRENLPASEKICSFRARVDEIELTIPNIRLFLSSEEHRLIANVDPSSKIKKGEDMEFAFDIEKVKLFDSESELAIVN